MNDPQVNYLGDVQKLSLKAGDVLVITVPFNPSGDHIRMIREHVGKMLPNGNEVLVLSEGAKIGVLEAA